MNATKTKVAAAVAATKPSFIEKAANSFMTMDIGMGKKTMTQMLPAAVRDLVIEKVGKTSTMIGDETDPENAAFDMNAKLFGPHHEDFKAMVLAPRAALRTYIYEATLSLSQQEGQSRGPRLVAVTRVPEVISKLAKLRKAADEAFEAFMPDYDRFCEAGRRAIDHKLPFKYNGKPISALLKYPSREAFREAFYTHIGAPKPLPTLDMSRYASLPVGLAAEIAEANAQQLTAQMENAKAQAIKAASELVVRVVTQLGKGGQRLHGTLITEAQTTSQMLRDLCEGYDFDVSLLSAADMIDNSIGKAASVEVWKEDPIARREALKAATTVSKVLSKAATAQKKKMDTAPVATGIKSAAGNLLMGGMLADLVG